MWISDILRWKRIIHWFSLSFVTAHMFRLDYDKYVWSEIIGEVWVKHIFSLLVRVTLPMFSICERQDHIRWRLNTCNVSDLTLVCFPFLFYRPPTKSREGDVFIRICVSMGGWLPCDHSSMMHWTTLYRGPSRHGTSGTPQPCAPLVTSSGHQWRLVQACSL